MLEEFVCLVRFDTCRSCGLLFTQPVRKGRPRETCGAPCGIPVSRTQVVILSGYAWIHQLAKDKLGSAAEHLCTCGAQAKDWAYQHTGSPEYVSNGAPFSLDLKDYAPLCKPSHWSLDKPYLLGAASRATEEARAEQSTRMKENGTGEVWSRAGTAALRDKIANDPEFRSAWQEKTRSVLKKINSVRYVCSCGKESTISGIRRHQKSSDHKGIEVVPNA